MAHATPAYPCAMAEPADKIAVGNFEQRNEVTLAPKGRSTGMYGVRRSPAKVRIKGWVYSSTGAGKI
ncbi:MAG: hypothetical protein AMJ55_00170 [Gammaproteobacteria bacterium SG8_15]|nr:MAG: hypothetical protein AMJ55_00170 [Gammaproteobacteria bacterium SG8_15]